jgi:hypothetical protein
MVSLIGTLVKSNPTSKLTIVYCGPARRESNVRNLSSSLRGVDSCQYEGPVGPPAVWPSDMWGPNGANDKPQGIHLLVHLRQPIHF